MAGCSLQQQKTSFAQKIKHRIAWHIKVEQISYKLQRVYENLLF